MHKLRFLGTGDAFSTDGRLSQALWIEPAGQSPFLVDAGPAVAAAIEREGLSPLALSRLFITHLHGDHIAGWPFLCLHFLFRGGSRPHSFEVWGPEGVRARLDALLEACYEDVLATHGEALEVAWSELPVLDQADLTTGDGLVFDTTPVDHHQSSLAYTFELGRHRVSVTGDTRWCSALEDLATRSTLLILECTSVEPTGAAHVSLEELRALRESLACDDIVLVHLSDAVANALAARPIPGVRAAEDGLELRLPT